MNILEQILADKLAEVGGLAAQVPLPELRARALQTPLPGSLSKALRSQPFGLVAEVKRRSPSAGVIRKPFDPAAIARAYAEGGAQAISVLMDQKYFGGGGKYFMRVRDAVPLPLLYKEFVVDAWQIWHARLLGASAVLLIASALRPAELKRLLRECESAAVEPLLEVHDADEMALAKSLQVPFVGINNRDLKVFKTDIQTSIRLAPGAPAGATVIAESGIRSAEDMRLLKNAGLHGALVGEHLLRQPDLVAATRQLLSKVRESA